MPKIAPLAAAALASGALLATGALATTKHASANTTVAATLGKPTELKIGVATIAKAGSVTFKVKNAGLTIHELIVLKTPTAAAKLKLSNGQAIETGNVAETGDIATGATKSITVTLPKGHYALICNIPGHYLGGMRKDFTVK